MSLKFKTLSLQEIKKRILSNKKYSVIVGFIFSMVLIIFFQNIEIIYNIASGKDNIILETQTIRKLQKKLNLELNRIKKIRAKKLSLIQKSAEFWISQRDGKANIKIQKKIEATARQLNVELKTLGTLRFFSKGDGIGNIEFDISCAGSLESIIKFIHKISNSQPEIY